MNNKKFKYYIFLLITAIGLFSCESDEDFLTEDPKSFYTVDNVFTSSNQVDQALVSCYSEIRSMKLSSNRMTRVICGSGTDVMDVAPLRNSHHFSDYSKLTAEFSRYSEMFSTLYEIISNANTALYAANLEGVKWSSEEDKKYAIAQAKFFRAYAYRNLGELYGGVPIVDEIITAAKYDFERSTRVETYQFAIDDLESSLNDLPETTSQGGRIVKGAALHYLSELYIALGTELEDQGQSGDEKFNKAVQYASQVIDGGTYALMTERFGTRKDREPGDVYWDLFRPGNVNYQDGNTECVWAYQVDFDAHVAEDDDATIWYPRDYLPARHVVQGFIIDIDGGDARSVAYTTPTMYTLKEIWEGDLWNDMRNAEHNIQRTFYYNDPSFEKFGEPYTEEEMYAITDNNLGMIYPIWWKITTDQWLDVGSGKPNSRIFRDDYAIRLPETILLRAEAFWRLGQNQNAANDINMIRQRAQCSYLVSAGDVTLDFILDERARELYIEEWRWNTLLRMGGTVVVDRLKTHNYWPNTNIQNTLNKNFNLWPIPQSVIDRNKDVKMEQNPGWM